MPRDCAIGRIMIGRLRLTGTSVVGLAWARARGGWRASPENPPLRGGGSRRGPYLSPSLIGGPARWARDQNLHNVVVNRRQQYQGGWP